MKNLKSGNAFINLAFYEQEDFKEAIAESLKIGRKHEFVKMMESDQDDGIIIAYSNEKFSKAEALQELKSRA